MCSGFQCSPNRGWPGEEPFCEDKTQAPDGETWFSVTEWPLPLCKQVTTLSVLHWSRLIWSSALERGPVRGSVLPVCCGAPGSLSGSCSKETEQRTEPKGVRSQAPNTRSQRMRAGTANNRKATRTSSQSLKEKQSCELENACHVGSLFPV